MFLVNMEIGVLEPEESQYQELRGVELGHQHLESVSLYIGKSNGHMHKAGDVSC